MQGFVYSTLEGAAVEGLHADSQQNEIYLAPPWDVAPANRAVIQRLVSRFPWSTSYLLLADGKPYPTLRGQKDSILEGGEEDPNLTYATPACYLVKDQTKSLDFSYEDGEEGRGGGMVLSVQPSDRPAPCRWVNERGLSSATM